MKCNDMVLVNFKSLPIIQNSFKRWEESNTSEYSLYVKD